MAAWVIAVGSVFVSPETTTDVTFNPPSLNLEGNGITLTVALSNWLSDDMNRILESGQTLTIHFDLDLFQTTYSTPLQEYSFIHAVTMDLIDQTYHVDCSELDQNLETNRRDEMRRLVGSLESFHLLELEEMQGDTSFYFRLSARLENIDLPGLMKNPEMMRFWNNTSPQLESPRFQRSDFIL
jgi:hypothetical protein